MLLQIGTEVVLATPARCATRQILDDQTGRIIGTRLEVFGIATGIADVRIGQRDDLAAIGRIGKNFLIAGHRGVENDFTTGDAVGADGLALENRPVGEGEDGGCE